MIKIHENDNVAVADDGHKIALRDIQTGENIIKYGYPIGHASRDIRQGELVHTHNLRTNLKGFVDYKYEPVLSNISRSGIMKFQGYTRSDGNIGIRNEIWIIPTVGCVNKTSENIAKRANEIFNGLTDGIFSFTHPYGCSQLGGDHLMTQKILSGLCKNPNAAGVLVLSLGCENNTVESFKDILGDFDENRIKFLITQEVGNEMAEALKLINELVDFAVTQKRAECDFSKLNIGLKCGGSDGFSGLTANPLVGRFSDIFISHGGNIVLTEVPEMFGAETILMNRCVNETIFHRTVDLINDFKQYYIDHDQSIYENPSPGNKAGGITTLEEKSLGCIQKGGTSDVVDVIDIGERVKANGLTLLNGPGNDIVSITNLAASGCQLILFTTGRGTPLGAPVPTFKIASNRNLAKKKPHWIDFNADCDDSEAHLRLFECVREIISGEQTGSEIFNYREIAIFKNGVTL